MFKITYMQAIRTGFGSLCAFPSQVSSPAVFAGFFVISIFIIFIADHVFAAQSEIAEAVSSTDIPDFFIANNSCNFTIVAS